MKPNTAFRLAIVGCGAIAELGHAPGALASSSAALTTLVDMDLERARALGSRFGIKDCRATTDGLEGSVDGVVAAVPHHVHKAVGMQLLSQGLHVLMEKPLGCSVAECQALAGAAVAANRMLATAMLRRFASCNRLAKRIVDSGILGAVESFEIRDGRLFSWPIKTPFLLETKYPGRGVLIGNGSHLFDLVLWWFGAVDTVKCVADTRNGGETDATVELTMATGARGLVRLSRVRELEDAVIIHFERATLELPPFGTSVRLLDRDGRPLMGILPQIEDPLATNSASMVTLMALQIDDFVSAARGRAGPEVTPKMAMETIALVERCAAAIEVVDVPWRRRVALPNRTAA